VLAAVGLLTVIAAGAVLWKMAAPGGDEAGSTQPPGNTIQTVRSGETDVVLLAPSGALRQGRNTFTIEFRAASDGTLVDVGTVHASANMPMPGMVMSSGLEVTRTSVPGRYQAAATFGMAGSWQMAIEWEGPAGRGSISFQGAVQ
jgi:hypothetical protein